MRRSLLLCACLLAAPVASAQDKPTTGARAPTAAELTRAKELRQRGHQNFDEQRYAEALALYRESHQLSRDPALLYNIGRAHQLLNQAPEALDAFEAFVAAASPELKAKVQGLEETIAEARKKVATLTISTGVSGARVLIRKVEVGKTPLKPLRLLAGDAEIEVISELHEPLSRKVTLRGGEAMSVELNLTPRKGGMLVLRSSVPGARAQVDGRPLGGVPAEVLLDPGEHKVVLSADGHKDASSTVVVAAGERRELSLDLEKKAAPSRWWLWTGIGVVVVGGIALGVALTTERSPDRGSLGQVSAPLLRFLENRVLRLDFGRC